MFIGSLYKQKKIFELLNAYKRACATYNEKPLKLHIVGDGKERENIEKWLKENDLQKEVIMHGAVFRRSQVKSTFCRGSSMYFPWSGRIICSKKFWLWCCSFITHENAITGGERLNIENNTNGILFSDFSGLTDIIIEIFESPLEKYLEMGKKAKKFYNTKRTPEIMANGFKNAINYVIKAD